MVVRPLRTTHFLKKARTASLPTLTRRSMRWESWFRLTKRNSFACPQHGPPGQARWWRRCGFV